MWRIHACATVGNAGDCDLIQEKNVTNVFFNGQTQQSEIDGEFNPDIPTGPNLQKERRGMHLICLNDLLGTSKITPGSLPFVFSGMWRIRVFDKANPGDMIEKTYSVSVNCFLSNGVACNATAHQW
jgi:hypothetical protein